MLKTEPREILENRRLERRPRPLAIVVFNAKQDAPIAVVRRLPDMEGIDDVAEVQETRWSGRKPCNHWTA